MNTLDIVLVSIISYMTGILSGLSFCFKYSDKLIKRTLSDENVTNMIQNPMNYPPQTNLPVIASAPPLREITIKTTE